MSKAEISESKEEFQYPDAVTQFLSRLYEAYNKKNKKELNRLYDFEFKRISEEHFKNKAWPRPEVIFHIFPSDDLFQCLYRELYYRHMYLKLEPKSIDLQNSFKSYYFLFRCLSELGDISFIPSHWIWDMLDEFVFQFQWRWSKTEKQGQAVAQSSNVQSTLSNSNGGQSSGTTPWSLHSVLSVLRNLVVVSGVCVSTNSQCVIESEEVSSSTKFFSPGAGSDSIDPLVRLGWFALVSIVRIYTLCGDFSQALKTITFMSHKFHKSSLFSSEPACIITFCRYAGFVGFYLKRYTLARTILSHGVMVYWRSKNILNTGTFHLELATKRFEQMLAMLAVLSVSEGGKKIDDSVNRLVNEKYMDRIKRLQNRDSNTLRELYFFFCPKLVMAASFSVHSGTALSESNSFAHIMELRKRQTTIFMMEEQQLLWHSIKNSSLSQKKAQISKISEGLKKTEDVIRRVIETQNCRLHSSSICSSTATHNQNLTNSNEWLSKDFVSAFSHIANSNISDGEFTIENNCLMYRDHSNFSDFRVIFLKEISRIKQLNCDLQIKMLSTSQVEMSDISKSSSI